VKRREFLKSSTLAAGALAAGKSFGAQKHPNVLLILVDQWRQPRWFPDDVKLPGFNRLRREGLSFTNHYVSAVPCSPSRACLFTGLHLPQHGVASNVNAGMNQSLDPRIPTLGHRFRAAGYRTPYFGKWHLTAPKDRRGIGLSKYGFEDWRGPDHHGAPWDGTTNDFRFAAQAANWLNRNGRSKEPWFLTCSLVNPHDICFYPRDVVPQITVPRVFDKLPDNFRDDLEGKPRIQAVYRDGYGRLMGITPDKPEKFWLRYLDYYLHFQRLADHGAAHLLDTLDRLKLADDTLVIFTADHGDMCGSHQLQAKGPFVYEENNNVPLIFRWPGRVPAGVESAALSQNTDVLPTLLEACGVSSPVDYLPGRSFAPLLQNPDGPGRDQVLMAFGMALGGKFAAIARHLGVQADGVPIQLRGIHDGRYKFARYFDPGCPEEYELYDLQEDPGELRNLAGDPAAAGLLQEMAERLAAAEAAQMAPVPAESLFRKV